MEVGNLVHHRFEIEARTGSGGMGLVYRALDRHTGARVALKVLHVTGTDAKARFSREAQVLADLRHPGIVRYVGHGVTPAGERFLAMEWLPGEDLQQRLQREHLGAAQAVQLVQRTAEALSVAHARGIVHRDIKPSNIFLVDGDLGQPKLLDFGIARARFGGSDATVAETALGTGTGIVLGTIGYSAPEQARGARNVGAPADVFSLGCVLYRCLTGRRPFLGDDPSAVLAKILLDEAPRARELCPEIPGHLDELIARMLAKDPGGRPQGAAEVAVELSSVFDPRDSAGPTRATSPSQALGTGERRIVSVVVAAPQRLRATGGTDDSEDASTARSSSPAVPGEGGLAPTLLENGTTKVEDQSDWRQVKRAVRELGACAERLADGVVVATLGGATTATDQAAHAARCALAFRTHWPAAPVALATGRGELIGQLPVGDVIDRAMRLLRLAQDASGTVVGRAGPIRVDEVTAGLLDARFELDGDARGLVLRGEHEAVESVRTLLGRQTPCIGREVELAVLTRIYEGCADSAQAQAVLVTAPAGVGKSRLRYEFLRALDVRDDDAPRPEIWTARGDPMSAGSPFGLLAQAIRRASSVRQGEPLLLRRQKLCARLARYLEGPALERTAEFLAEIISAPVPDAAASVQLRAARQDAVLMGDQRRRAWEEWLAAECAHQPVLLVLEDLQWGDLPTIAFVDGALRNLREKPFMVLAIARPEVHVLFPKLWSERRVQEIRLGELTRRPIERLVRQHLGPEVPPETVRRIVELSAGNAFYVEELIRAVAEGNGDSLPETVLAMAQARLSAVDAEARWILRAASVYGGAFWGGAVRALLGGSHRTGQIDPWLAVLTESELVTRRAGSRFPGEDEYSFRHSLIREAAYAMLTDSDRVLGHRLAAEWLERVGETDAAVLAEHFERAQEPARAMGWYEKAAFAALEGNDFVAAKAWADRALACGATGTTRGGLVLLQAEAHRWAAEHGSAAQCAALAMPLLATGGPAWFAAAGELGEASGRLGDAKQLRSVGLKLAACDVEAAQGSLPIIAIARVAVQLLYAGDNDLACRLVGLLGQAPASIRADPTVEGWIANVQATQAMLEGDVGAFLALAKTTVAAFRRAGDLRHACLKLNLAGFAAIEAGAHGEAETALRDALAAAEQMGLPAMVATTQQNLGILRTRQGALDEARLLETRAMEVFHTQGDLRMEGGCLIYRAIIELEAGEPERACADAVQATHVLASVPGRAHALGLLAQADLARGAPRQGFAAAESAMRLLEEHGQIEEGEALVRLAWAEALAAVGRREEARTAFEIAERRLLERAEKIGDPILRRGFLENVPDNSRTLEGAEAIRLGFRPPRQ